MTDYQGLHSRFLRGLALSPQRPAFRVGDRTMTYEEAHDLALRWAGSLLAGLPAPPKAIGVLSGRGVDAYVGILAALYCGAAVVPLHPEHPPVRTRRMLELSGAAAAITDDAGSRALARTELTVPALGHALADDAGAALAAPGAAAETDVAYILFTSGSTGEPKGMPISHGNLRAFFELVDDRYETGPGDVFSQVLELNFDCAVFELFGAWGAGGSVEAVPARAYLDLPAFLTEREVSVWFSTPAAISLARRMGALSPGALPTLRYSFFAGEALRCADAADWQRAAAGSVVENLYGPAELTLTITGHRFTPGGSEAMAVNGIVPIGTVHPGHDHLLLADDGGPADGEGELCVTGPQMINGYLDPRDDQGRFLSHDGRRWYRTGDRVRVLPNGELAYLGRLDAQVQLHGWRVELAEIDHAVRQCPGIRNAVTVTRPQDGSVELVVFYTGVPTSRAAFATHLGRILPRGIMPTEFRHVEDFPLNHNKKIDRKRLAREATADETSSSPAR